ncbi:MAG: patatin-like phospholipase family protein [Methylocella sp.]
MANEAVVPKIGLALSGGGSRAIAFHLGCLRALNQFGLLDRIAVLSTVSGGSVIGAYFHAHQGDFPSFEAKIRDVLAQGLVKPMRGKVFGVRGIKIVAAFIVVGFVAACVALVKLPAKCLSLIAPQWISSHWERLDIRSPLHRFASRTTLLEAALDEVLFTGACLNDLPRQPHLVVNATELRTGSAFRFGTLESGSWRWGKLHRNAVSVAHAVAASAAYPLFLPAFDETLTFDKGGELKNVRVILTDGGIYDNLGLGCLWPDRSEEVSLNVIPVDTIICCSAGYGLRQEPPSQFIFARVLSVFSTCLIARRTLRCTGCTRRGDPATSRASYFRISGNLTGNCRTLPPTSCAGRRPTPTPPISAPCRTSGSSASACAGNN